MLNQEVPGVTSSREAKAAADYSDALKPGDVKSSGCGQGRGAHLASDSIVGGKALLEGAALRAAVAVAQVLKGCAARHSHNFTRHLLHGRLAVRAVACVPQMSYAQGLLHLHKRCTRVLTATSGPHQRLSRGSTAPDSMVGPGALQRKCSITTVLCVYTLMSVIYTGHRKGSLLPYCSDRGLSLVAVNVAAVHTNVRGLVFL